MNKKEFALFQIAPYFKDPSICGFEDRRCKYITSDGRMCVAGKNIIDPTIVADESLMMLIELHGQEGLFKPEAANILSDEEWVGLLFIHDEIADPSTLGRYHYIDQLGLFTYEELVTYSNTI